MKINNKDGFSLVTSLGFITALTLVVGAIGLKITNERGKLQQKNNDDRLTLISRSLEKVAIEALKFQARTNFNSALDSYWGAGDIVPTDTTTQENQGLGFLTSGLSEINESNNTILYDTFNKTGTSESVYIGNPVKFKILFFNDKNNNGILDVGKEETSYLVNKVISADNKSHSYTYMFNITTYAYTGEDILKSKNKRKISTTGNFTLSSSPNSFAKYAMFLNQSSGAMFWWGDTIRGPFHSNDKIIFAGDLANGGKSGTFHGKVTSASSSVAWYYLQNGSWKNGGTTTPPLSDKNPKLVSGTTVRVAPDFKEGFERGVPTIDLPTNSFSQNKAALGYSDTDPSAGLTVAQQKSLLGITTGSSVPNGIYLPSKDSSGNPVTASNPPANSTTNGGIYVKGDVDSIIMSTPNDPGPDGISGNSDDHTNQEYLIKQGSNLKRVTVDYENGTTKYETLNSTNNTVTSTTTVNGTTNGVLQVDGKINYIGGPPRTDSNDPGTAPPAIHSDNQLTISATGDIIIQRDIKYQTDPRGADGTFGTADDVPTSTAKNILGFYSSAGNVRVGTQTQKDFTLHGVVMGSGSSKGFRVDNASSRPQSGKIHLLGGTIENSLSATENSSGTTGFGTDYTYDQRTGKGLAPPYFPGSTLPAQNDPLIQINSSYESIIR